MDIPLRKSCKGLCSTCSNILDMNCFKRSVTKSEVIDGFNNIIACTGYVLFNKEDK